MLFSISLKKIISDYAWPFDDLGIALLHTGAKMATHQHLKTLKEFDAALLEPIVDAGVKAFKKQDGKNFVEAIKNDANAMQSRQGS